MKRIFLLLGIFAFVGLLSGCGCKHTWQEADCLTAKTCSQCAAVEGEALGHQFQEATCTEPKTCARCAAVEGEALGHQFQEATCAAPKTCAKCALTEGEVLPHQFREATCTEPKTCTGCALTEGEALGHSFRDATCQKPKECTVCQKTEGERAEHAYVYHLCKYCSAVDPQISILAPEPNLTAGSYECSYFKGNGYYTHMVGFGNPMYSGEASWSTDPADAMLPDQPEIINGKEYYYCGGSAGHEYEWNCFLTDTQIFIYSGGSVVIRFLLLSDGGLYCTYGSTAGLTYYRSN